MSDDNPREFMECDSCRSKPGSPVLCRGCLHNRQLFNELTLNDGKSAQTDKPQPTDDELHKLFVEIVKDYRDDVLVIEFDRKMQLHEQAIRTKYRSVEELSGITRRLNNLNEPCSDHSSCYQQGLHDGFEECRDELLQELNLGDTHAK